MNKSRVFSIVLSLFLITMIVLSGPSYGIDIFINGLTVHNKNDIIPFTITLNFQEGELIPINHINLTITFPNSTKTTCIIFPNGTIQNCKFVIFENISFSGSYSYGYGYGYESETKYDLGYGYGYAGPGYMNLSLKLNTSYLSGGNYQIKTDIFAGYDQTHLFSSTTSSFTILEFPWITTTTITTTYVPNTTTMTTTSTTITTTVQTTLPSTSTTETTNIPTTQITTTSLQTTTTVQTTTYVPNTTTTSTTTSIPMTTTTINICYGNPITTCLITPNCEWVGDTRLGYCKQKIIPTTVTTETQTTTTTTTLQTTTTTIPSICDGKGFINCILMSQCKWLGDTKTGKCVLSETYVTTTTTTEIPVTTTTIFIPSNCQQKSFFSCLISSECKWLGDLRLGYCIEK
ncbi:MAG: hypothetical protein KQA41_03710 [Candidatus Aenigmarchaeota archaeon]|nr:hypothetical protein [Candidatus Aenigmarchaeota archaeon]